ncbi:hypothetical protein GCM10010145_67870 [Streptomyces ruber]|uniref:Uncharacterized protein n=3 Tax=Streptomyces TaxID=1883 RepID=A0A918BS88_9ACTN|nr:DUF6153 family protein [Streptomyces ruber]GGQ88768.1 hypothetical protein GCM10010145_67870 [Streptomyces ruber]
MAVETSMAKSRPKPDVAVEETNGRRAARYEALDGFCPPGRRQPAYDEPMMSRPRTGSQARPARWVWLVLAVVAGVLGMHALSPAGMPAAGRHDMTMSVQLPGHHSTLAPDAGDGCRHMSDTGSGGMVMDHAAGTCAADGISTAYVPPALLPALAARLAPAAAACRGPAARTADGRAPPDLSELQLLRI